MVRWIKEIKVLLQFISVGVAPSGSFVPRCLENLHEEMRNEDSREAHRIPQAHLDLAVLFSNTGVV